MKKAKKGKVSLPSTLIMTIIVSALVIAGGPLLDRLKAKTQTEQRQAARKWQLAARTYRTDWSYITGSGKQNEVGFSLTLEGDIIRDVQVEVLTESEESIKYQKKFAKELPKFIVGKKLAEVAALDRVAGASGTTKNFKDAVEQLQKEI